VLVHGASGGVVSRRCRSLGRWDDRVGDPADRTAAGVSIHEGAHHVLDHKWLCISGTGGAHPGRGAGVDVILEMLANVNLGKELTVWCRGGRWGCDRQRGTVEITPRDAMARDAAILGM